MQITAVGFLRYLARPGKKTNLFHGKRKRLPLDSFTARRLRVEYRVLRRSSAKRIRKESGSSHGACPGHELPACESVKVGHDSSLPEDALYVETRHCRVSLLAPQIRVLAPITQLAMHLPGIIAGSN